MICMEKLNQLIVSCIKNCAIFKKNLRTYGRLDLCI